MTLSKAEPAWWKHFVAGNVGGIFGLFLVYPMDTVKIRLQTRAAGSATAYRGILHCFSSMVRSEGIFSLYRGLLSPVLGYGAIKSVAFGSYQMARKQISGKSVDDTSVRTSELVAAGAVAGFTQTFIRTPVEQIKTVMQARTRVGALSPYKSSLHCAVDVIRTEGIYVGLYRSLNATMLREVPQYAMYYASYELLKRQAAQWARVTPDNLSPLTLVLVGGTAGTIQWIPTYPIDVIKSRISSAHPGEYRGVVDCVKKCYRAEGFSVFWRGFQASLLRAFPLHGAIFIGYEMTMKSLNV